jgi:superfamily II DNA or RNA helicase
MGLFGRPGEKLLQAYRNALRIVTPDHFLPIRWQDIKAVRWKPEHYLSQIGPKAHHLDGGELQVKPRGTTHGLSVVCLTRQVDLTVLPGKPAKADLNLPPLEIRQENLLSLQAARVSQRKNLVSLEALAKIIKLITQSDFKLRSVDLLNFNPVTRRFSFPPVRDDTTTSLFRERRPPGLKTIRVGPVAPPDPPPSLRASDLKERLRWLLTPPIHEVLSDPKLTLPATPFPYQTFGIKWLYDRENCLLADEMGLGKTMQAILAARLLWRDRLIKHILIVCPKSLIPNWRKELRTWWPGIDCYTMVVGADRKWFLRLATSDVAVKIINYEALRRELNWLKEEAPHHDLVIIDEAQRIKNPQADQCQAVKALKSDRRWALTGTPLENSLDDLVSIFGWIRPGLVRGDEGTKRIREAARPFILRRRQEEVLKDLPEKIEQDIEVELGQRQRQAYDLAEREGVVHLNEKGDTITVHHVLALITKLRQICNFDQTSGESAKADLLVEELEEILESRRKALIFSQFVDERFGLKRLAKFIAECKTKKQSQVLQLHGEISPRQREGIVDQFQNNPNHQIMLVNYSVGGVGLNLQAANYVFLFDRWWNPAVEDQAIKRCHRLGQEHKVIAKRFYCSGTIEERILTVLDKKRRIFSDVIDEDRPTVSLGLTEEEIFSLFKGLTVRPRRSTETHGPTQVVLDNLDPKRFEDLVATIYEKMGYDIKVTGGSHDGGIDIVADRESAGAKDRIIVQCKHQKHNVGRPVLQQLWGILNNNPSLTRCDVVTSAGFTTEALAFAAGKRLTLIDRIKLEELARRHGVANFVNL